MPDITLHRGRADLLDIWVLLLGEKAKVVEGFEGLLQTPVDSD